ncbi:helix-turn-helix domain-containing protein [Flavobacterium sp. CYK-4]|uniref:AraC family transcriptional regulator n=1 Tax=Flavobacterium lotistagni TaxID=2709660 RepID=UPI00140BAFB1|nr:helix-turn-helix transcriptional regulator [Flavobacterium lotistagni]NHM08025.1 helix-turn-helix domain-containing protein [Flavobacterium lotistagni]
MPNASIPVRQIKPSFFEERFSVRSIADLTSGKALVHDLHRHDFYFLLFVANGSGRHAIDFIEYQVSDNVVFFVRPGQVHELVLQAGASGFIIQFTADFYAPKEIPVLQVLRKVSGQNFCKLSVEGFEQIAAMSQRIFHEFSQKQFRYQEAIKSYLNLLFIALARQSSNSAAMPDKSKLYAQERLEEFQDLLERHISTKKQVTDYAQMLSMTSYQLNAITKSLVQKTASELINDHIVLEAKRMLMATSSLINQLADALGYDDPSYFIRFFKKKTGSTPEAFRHNFK